MMSDSTTQDLRGDGCVNQCSTPEAVSRHRSDELIGHADYLADTRVRTVLDAVEGLYGSPARQPIDEAIAEQRGVHYERLFKTEDQLREAQSIAAHAQGSVTMLADHLVALHRELGDHVAALEAKTSPAKRPAYVVALRELHEGQATVLANVLAAAAVG